MTDRESQARELAAEGRAILVEKIRGAWNDHAQLEHASRLVGVIDRLESLASAETPKPAAPIELLNALRFYANGNHMTLSDESAWDTVSDEPRNLWCDEAGTAMIEDGSLAAAALRGEPIDWTADDGEVPAPIARDVFFDSLVSAPAEPTPIDMVRNILDDIKTSHGKWGGWSGIPGSCDEAIKLLRFCNQGPTLAAPPGRSLFTTASTSVLLQQLERAWLMKEPAMTDTKAAQPAQPSGLDFDKYRVIALIGKNISQHVVGLSASEHTALVAKTAAEICAAISRTEAPDEYERGCAETLAAVLAVLDGEDTGEGVSPKPWEAVRRRLLQMVAGGPFCGRQQIGSAAPGESA